MIARAALPAAGLIAFLSACGVPSPQAMTLPPADGRAAEVQLDDGYGYIVNLQAIAQARGGVLLRISRASAPEMDYSEGLAAKKAAEAYCARFNRVLDPATLGRFSVPASWIFEGGCL